MASEVPLREIVLEGVLLLLALAVPVIKEEGVCVPVTVLL